MEQKRAPDTRQAQLQQTAQRERDQLKQTLFSALDKVNQLEQDLADKQAELQLVYASTSWRLTSPLRNGSLLVRRLIHAPRQSGAALAAVTTRFPRLRHFLIRQLDRFPSLRERLRSKVMPSLVSGCGEQQCDFARHMTAEQLPPSAQRIYQQLLAELRNEHSP